MLLLRPPSKATYKSEKSFSGSFHNIQVVYQQSSLHLIARANLVNKIQTNI